MSSSEGSNVEEPELKVVFEKECDLSDEEPPREEWSSLGLEMPEENIKRINYAEGLYNPGSGEICTKYISLSASSVFRHPYYNYPGVVDPGIKEALLHPLPKIIYADDGQELYLAVCKEMGACPVRIFYRQLLEDTIDLKYYGVNPTGIRPMAISLKLNRIVKVFDLTDNWINADGCFHLGEMLIGNITLTELNISGCRIGPVGARQLFANFHLNRALRVLNLSKNQLGDDGVEYFAKAVFKGANVTSVNLSYNNLSAKTAMNLSEVFETNNKLTHLNLSWNSILSPNAISLLCQRLSENLKLEELDLSWNSMSGPRVGNALKILMKNPNIRKIILTNNRLQGEEIKIIATSLPKAKKLQLLDLSYNPLTSDDAMTLLHCFKDRAVKLQKLIMENVIVNIDFLQCLEEVTQLKFRKDTVITYGGIKSPFISQGSDRRDIALSRADAICRQAKKNRQDIALIILALHKENPETMELKEFSNALKSRGANLDDALLDEFSNIFTGSRLGKAKTISLSQLVDYIKRKWPDRHLPPAASAPAPPESVPEQEETEEPKKNDGIIT